MHLDSYISDLLYRYDCVTVPGFGAFLTKKIPATVNETTQVFYPPKKQLSFNEQLQNNDGLLATYVSDTEKLPYNVAVKKINKHVRAIKSYLVEGETISLLNIGDISLNGEGKMVFEPASHVNYLTDAFGLAQFKSGNIKREVFKKEVETIEQTVPLTLTPEKRTSQPYLKYAAVALIALTMAGFGGTTYYGKEIEKQNAIAQEEATRQLDNKIQEATFIIENPLPAATLNVDRQSGNYHIVAGAFRVRENSLQIVKKLRILGYMARNIGVNKYGLHEVVYGSYESRSEAQRALSNIRRNHNTEAWLLIRDLE